MHKYPNFSPLYLRRDIMGGITAAVVALPLALAFGVSSGAGAIAGIYGAIIVGFFAALFGGTATQISGPTGPMTVVMAVIITDFQAQFPDTGLAMAFTTVMLAGLLQIIFGLCKLGKFFTLVPYSVISGFMSGIGLIIIIIQLAPFLGLATEASITTALIRLPNNILQANTYALLLGITTLCIILFWPKQWRAHIPSALAALIIGTLLLLLLPQNNIPIIGYIPSGTPNIHWPTLEPSLWKHILYSAFLLAMLGSIDSLLTSLVADNLSRTQHDPNKELIGQGTGNLIAGLFGGLPGAGATMRTVVNINAGSKTRLSGMIHALILLAIILGAAPLAEHIPHAVLAGILIKVGIDIIDWEFIRRIHRTPLASSSLMLMVLSITVFYDLITAVLLGVFITNIITVNKLSELQKHNLIISNGKTHHPQLSPQTNQQLNAQQQTLLFCIKGVISFGAARHIPRLLQDFNNYRCLIIDLSEATLINFTTAVQIDESIREAQNDNICVFLVGLSKDTKQLFFSTKNTATAI